MALQAFVGALVLLSSLQHGLTDGSCDVLLTRGNGVFTWVYGLFCKQIVYNIPGSEFFDLTIKFTDSCRTGYVSSDIRLPGSSFRGNYSTSSVNGLVLYSQPGYDVRIELSNYHSRCSPPWNITGVYSQDHKPGNWTAVRLQENGYEECANGGHRLKGTACMCPPGFSGPTCGEVGYDTLFLSLCLHISTKCDILKTMLRRAGQRPVIRQRYPSPVTKPEQILYDFEYWRDDGSALEAGSSNGLRDETQQNLRTCVLYHNMIIGLRSEMEEIFAGVSLWQMGYILLGLGIPGLRLLREPISRSIDVMFLVGYAMWNFMQLLFYCWFADLLAASSGAVAEAAYAALRPAEIGDVPSDWDEPEHPTVVNLSKAAGITLKLLAMRAQRPLYLTAGNVFNITLELYLTIMRKSQSIYSYLIRMR